MLFLSLKSENFKEKIESTGAIFKCFGKELKCLNNRDKYTQFNFVRKLLNISELYNNIPFVAIPLGADNPFISSRVSELGATISFDKNKLTPEILKNSVEKVLTDPKYLENIKKISKTFKDAGGYKKAVQEIFKFKKERNVNM